MARDPEEKAGGEERTVLFDSRGKRRDGATQITKAPEASPDQALFKLVSVRGPRQGKQFPLRGTELTVGRDERNDVVIPDISVSRRHAKLRRHPDGWTVTALGDDSIVRVNGLKIDQHPLASGDLVELGKAELQFVESDAESVRNRTGEQAVARDSGKAAAARRTTRSNAQTELEMPAAGASNTRIRKVAIACFAVVAISLFLKGTLHHSPRTVDQPQAAVDTTSPGELFAAARKEVLAQHWTAAQQLLTRAAKLDPENPQIRHYLEIVTGEVANQNHLDAAEKALGAKDFKVAQAELALVPADSLLADQVTAERAKIDTLVQAQVEVATTAFAAGDLKAAADALALALAGDPRNVAALGLKAQVEGKRTTEQVTASEEARAAASRSAEQRRQTGPIGQAKEQFRSGDLKGALATLGQAPPSDLTLAAQLQDQMTRAEQAFQEGESLSTVGSGARAAELLSKARSLANAIVPGSSMAAQANQKLAKLEDKLGLAARNAGNGEEAYKHFAAALAANSQDDQAQAEIKRLAGEAHDLFLEAYSMRQSDPEAAERKFRKVLGMTAKGSADHQASQQKIDQLDKGAQ